MGAEYQEGVQVKWFVKAVSLCTIAAAAASCASRTMLVLNRDRLPDGGEAFDVPGSEDMNPRDALTVEALVCTDDPAAEAMQPVVSKWSPRVAFDAFDAYDATTTSGLDTSGFLGAVFDGRFVYFSPQHDRSGRHGKALRYDTHGAFHDTKSWVGYDASHTDGLVTKGYYGAVYDGRYVYYVPRMDGKTYHSRALRYDTHLALDDRRAWEACDAGLPISYQSAGFDGRYIYFSPGTHVSRRASGTVLRYDTQKPFKEGESWITYDADGTGGLPTRDFDGVVFDGRYMYFVPLHHRAVLRYDTAGDFSDEKSWNAFNAGPLGMKMCVGGVFDGTYVYFVPYDHYMAVRYDTRGGFIAPGSWTACDVRKTPRSRKHGYDGGFFDGRYVYFIPFFFRGQEGDWNFHCEVLRHDTMGDFGDPSSWRSTDAGSAGGLHTVGYNAGAYDGRYFYFAPWHDGSTYAHEEKIVGHGRVLRYDTLGENGSFSLRYCDYGHNGGLCAALPGPRFLVNTDRGVRSVAGNRRLEPGEHYIVGTYDGRKIRLFVDGVLVNERDAAGGIVASRAGVSIGKFAGGPRLFRGRVRYVGLSSCARSPEWVQAQHHKLTRDEH